MREAVPVLVNEKPGAAPTFEEYVAARSRALWRSAWLLTGDRHKAEDLVQTALMKCWGRWDRIDGGAVDAYVRRTMLTTYTDWWRRRWNGEVPTGTLPDRPSSGDADAGVRQDVLVALASLPRGQRAVVVLRFFDDLSEAQTAEALGISAGTVKSQTSRALRALRTSGLLEDSHE
ncbi:SigE family RNA polymerase sigma factor [Nocardioides sp. WS12]|uniref:SigE family RNA polymerase sigma factor n=1 Tax=Nocardioides sp. WS12 TaxID=2486272 RepID=UPI0015F8E66A|nr:SigE family RNA polymerase sigma factor [Nocardioides sp. WS12]